jgi:hypothetical protein
MRTIFIGLSLLAASCVMREQPTISIEEGGCPIKVVYQSYVQVYDCDSNLIESYGYNLGEKREEPGFLRNKYIYENGRLVEEQEWGTIEDITSLSGHKIVYQYEGDSIIKILRYEKKTLQDSVFHSLQSIEDWKNNKFISLEQDSFVETNYRSFKIAPKPVKFRGW